MNWQHTFLMRDLLSDDTSDENAVRVAKELAKRMIASGLFTDYDGQDIIEDLEFHVDSCDYLNDVLDRFYDYCDGHAIWVPLSQKRSL